ncbi:MAG: hypothetical protein HQM00_00390 [Magnetococcales bacterium]|nr:hypothetical protein [Magnetococcales bacterium]
MHTPPKNLRLPWILFLTSGCFTLLCLINLFSFHEHRATFLEKYAFYSSQKCLIQTRNLFNNVSQVQNQLTDISATLGLDNLDQGFDRAREETDAFHAGLINLRQLLEKHPTKENPVPDLSALEARFDLFHSLGIEMAHAYIQNGTFRGNQKMKLFDAEADQLRDTLNEMSTFHKEHAEFWRKKITRHAHAFSAPGGVGNLLWFHLMGDQTRTHYVQFMTLLVQTAPHQDNRMRLSIAAGELQGQVIQVQQWLTDLAATRGQDGLDEGNTKARLAAENFLAALPAFLELIREHDNETALGKTADLERQFKTFYRTGQELAKAYILGGAKRGNPFMRAFDKQAEELNTELKSYIDPTLDDANTESFQMDLVHDSLQEIRKILFFLSFLSLIVTIAASAWLASCRRLHSAPE